MSQLRNQLKDLTFDQITAGNLQQVGGRVFADAASRENVNDLVNVQSAWSAVHLPTFGHLIPQTGLVEGFPLSNVGETTILEPANNEVYEIWGLNVKNAGVGGATYTIQIRNIASEDNFSINGDDAVIDASSIVQILDKPLRIGSHQGLYGIASTILSCQIYYYKVVQ